MDISTANSLNFEPARLPESAHELRPRVREFLEKTLIDKSPISRSHSWESYDEDFSSKLGAQGWIGMTLPKKYGGHGKSFFERYVVVEECLVAGAPTAFHWVADRQSGQLLVKYGSEEQKQKIIPDLVAGKLCFAIGMSEPNSGSDLASLKCKAERTENGWLVNGTKIWTSNAHRAHYMIALLRTDSDQTKKHAGLSQFIIDLKESKGIKARPIQNLAGGRNFNEVSFTDVELPPDALIGKEGEGWKQCTEELALERSGPERYLSCFFLFRKLIESMDSNADGYKKAKIGSQLAWAITLRNMSLSIAKQLEEGQSPTLAASIVKDLGCQFEQDLPGFAQELCDLQPTADGVGTDYQQILGNLIQIAPSFSLRGGTPEIMKGIIAKGLGLK